MLELVYNKVLQANNVFEFDVDYEKALKLVQPHLEGLNRMDLTEVNKDSFHYTDAPLSFFIKIPKWNGDISWVSAASKKSFDFFDTCFRDLEIAHKTRNIVNLDFPLIMYSGFFVIRSFGTTPYFHNDYFNSGVSAFTFMTPIQFDEEAASGHLLYKNTSNVECTYKYRKGKGITFGSDFLHSTEPFKSEQKFIFLCFTYGSTDLNMWEHIKATASNQGVSYRHPDGNIVVTKPEFEKYF